MYCPHSAYSAFTHGLSCRWTFVSKTMSDIQNLLVPLEHAIHECLLPALTGHPSCSVFDQAFEKDSSSWLSAISIADHGFQLKKEEFRDALCLRYDWSLPNVPQYCSCEKQFSVNHAMTCHLGGFLCVRHNDIRDFTASLLMDVCHNVAAQPTLQSLNGETFFYLTANTDAEARAKIRARGFWSKSQDAHFDVRVFNPNAFSYVSKRLSALFPTHEQAKKRKYGQHI